MFRTLRPLSVSASQFLTARATRSPSALPGSAVAKHRLQSVAAHLSSSASAPPALNSTSTPKATMATLGSTSKKHKVTIVGSGNWGTTMAKIVAENVKAHPALFDEEVQMWVYEEDVVVDKKSQHYDEASPLCQGTQKLSEVINEIHENVKYLPNITLPSNVIANPSLEDAARNSTILVFVIPHQFIARICDRLKGGILPFARGISCTKGVDVSDKGIQLFSESIGQRLGIYCGALSGANIATEIAQEKYSETTVAYDPPQIDSRQPSPTTSPSHSTTDLVTPNSKSSSSSERSVVLHPLPIDYPPLTHENVKKLFHRSYFHVRMVSDVAGVSLGGALKNVVALAAGFMDGLAWGDNAKAAVMRVGLLEMVKFGTKFFAASCRPQTFTEESCGMADVVTSCMGGRNFRCAKLAIERGMSVEDVEKAELNGQKLQGTSTAYEVHSFLESQGMVDEFPLFTAVYNILEGKMKAEDIPDLIEPKD